MITARFYWISVELTKMSAMSLWLKPLEALKYYCETNQDVVLSTPQRLAHQKIRYSVYSFGAHYKFKTKQTNKR